jgi:DNA processing protein
VLTRRGDPSYPVVLEDLSDPPQQLFWLGDHWPPPRRAVAVVGARAASPYALEMAATLAADLARAGVAVVSGLARGVDAAAHRGALQAGGVSIAVLAAAPERPYPPESGRLHRELLERGAVCAEYGGETPLRRGLFIRRNRIVAGLSQGVVVVEAGVTSGALSTAAVARKSGRFVAAVPGDVTRESALGCLCLLRQGAVPVGSAGEVLAEMTEAETPGTDAKDRLFRALSSGGTVGALAVQLERPLIEIQAELTVLELGGVVERARSGVYRLSRGHSMFHRKE